MSPPTQLARAGYRPERGQGHRQDGQARHRRHARRRPRSCAPRAPRCTRSVRSSQDAGRAAVAADRSDARLRRVPAVEPEAGAVPGTCCATPPTCNLKTWYHAARPRTRTSSRRTSTASRASARTSWPTRSPRTRSTRATAPSPSSATRPPSTRASGSRPRSTGACSATCSTHATDNATDIPTLLRNNELWFVPIVNVDGYDYTFTAKDTRLWRKNLRDNNGDDGITPATTASTPTATGRRSGTTTRRAPPTTPASDTYHGPAPAVRARGQRARRAARPALKPKFLIDYHSFAPADPLPRGLAGRDAEHRHAADDGARRRRRPPGDRGLRPRRLGRALHDQRRRHRRRLQRATAR